jgi:hypothetical protein
MLDPRDARVDADRCGCCDDDFSKESISNIYTQQPDSVLHRKIAAPIHSHRMVLLPSGGKLCHSYCEDVSKSVCAASGPKRDQSTGEHNCRAAFRSNLFGTNMFHEL